MSDISVFSGRRLSLENARLIGSGFTSNVYLLEDDNVVKVLKAGTPEEAAREIRLSKWAFSKGIPTAISYDVVDVDGRPGLVYESLGRGNLRNAFRDAPDRFDEILSRYLALLHTIHGIRDEEKRLPPAADRFRAALDTVADRLTPEEVARMAALLATVPHSDALVHGDCQIKNVRIVKGELFLIDLDTLSRGDPIFELASLYCCYRGYCEIGGAAFDTFFEVPTALLSRILDGLLDGYFPDLLAADKAANREKIALLAYLYMFFCAVTDMPDDPHAAAVMARRFREILPAVDDLVLAR